MAITSVSEFLSAVAEPKNQLGLLLAPISPWYLGQPDLKGDLTPAFFKSGISPDLERELLRDYRQMSAEFAPVRGLADQEIMISGHLAGMPSRIIEWSANPLVALFLAVESMGGATGRIWVLNPWRMNELASNLAYVPTVESDYFKKYVVKLDDPGASTVPEAGAPMAFRPNRIVRN